MRVVAYHLPSSVMPKTLRSSAQWPVFWIESICDSPLTLISVTEFLESCLCYYPMGKKLRKELFSKILWKTLDDIACSYRDKPKSKKASQYSESRSRLLMHVWHKLNLDNEEDVAGAKKKINDLIGQVVEHLFSEGCDVKVDICSLIARLRGDGTYRRVNWKQELYAALNSVLPSYLTSALTIILSGVDFSKSDETLKGKIGGVLQLVSEYPMLIPDAREVETGYEGTGAMDCRGLTVRWKAGDEDAESGKEIFFGAVWPVRLFLERCNEFMEEPSTGDILEVWEKQRNKVFPSRGGAAPDPGNSDDSIGMTCVRDMKGADLRPYRELFNKGVT